MDTIPASSAISRGDLTDGQWAPLAPLLPVGKKPGRPPKWAKRQLIDAIRWRTRVGAPWREIPERYGPWQNAYGLFRSWSRNGTWAQIPTKLQTRADAAGAITWDVSIDSTITRAHQHAAGARKDGAAQKQPPGGVVDEPADHGLDRSRGGWTSKLHLACEQGQKMLTVVVTAGQRGDSPQFAAVLDGIRVPRTGPGRPRTRPDRVLADKAYSAKANRDLLRQRGIPATIPIKADQAPTGANADRQAADPRPSTPNATNSATLWNAESTGSRATAPSPPDTTSSPAATRPPSPSPPSTIGCDRLPGQGLGGRSRAVSSSRVMNP